MPNPRMSGHRQNSSPPHLRRPSRPNNRGSTHDQPVQPRPSTPPRRTIHHHRRPRTNPYVHIPKRHHPHLTRPPHTNHSENTKTHPLCKTPIRNQPLGRVGLATRSRLVRRQPLHQVGKESTNRSLTTEYGHLHQDRSPARNRCRRPLRTQRSGFRLRVANRPRCPSRNPIPRLRLRGDLNALGRF